MAAARALTCGGISATAPTLVFEGSYEDRYLDPGDPAMRADENGQSRLVLDGDAVFLFGDGLPLSPADRELASYVAGVSCRHCLERFSDADRQRFAERQRQMERARQRGEYHLGGRHVG